jgi:hypothetical protein
MQKVRYSLLVFGMVILIADVASINFNNLRSSENWLSYLIFIAMTATLVSIVRSIRSAANKSEDKNN